jgi:hypothetical protein
MSVFRRRTPQPGSQVMLLLPLAQDLRERGDELSAQLVCTRDPGLVVLFAAALGAAAPPERAVHRYLAVSLRTPPTSPPSRGTLPGSASFL